jgi:hypothetical protein
MALRAAPVHADWRGGRTPRLATGTGEVDRSTLFHARSDAVVPRAVKLFALDLWFSQFLL